MKVLCERCGNAVEVDGNEAPYIRVKIRVRMDTETMRSKFILCRECSKDFCKYMLEKGREEDE